MCYLVSLTACLVKEKNLVHDVIFFKSILQGEESSASASVTGFVPNMPVRKPFQDTIDVLCVCVANLGQDIDIILRLNQILASALLQAPKRWLFSQGSGPWQRGCRQGLPPGCILSARKESINWPIKSAKAAGQQVEGIAGGRRGKATPQYFCQPGKSTSICCQW